MSSNILFFAIPIMILLSSVFLYRFHGRRELFKFDFIQFLYAFVISPILIICVKSFLFMTLREDLGIQLSLNQLFIVDSLFMLVFLYIYGFVVIHSLTSSFKLAAFKDPLTDLLHYNEYFHLWLSHIVIFIGLGVIFSLLSVVNILFPFEIALPKYIFYGELGGAVIAGIVGFIGISLGDPKQAGFMKLMKLAIGVFFLLHAGMYFIFDPAFNATYLAYWSFFIIFSTMAIFSIFANRSERTQNFIDRFKHKSGWGENPLLFNKDRN